MTSLPVYHSRRHVLRFGLSAPLGYHIHLCSSTHFVFGDEEKVMAELTKESCRFVDNALSVMASLGRCIQAFSDPEGLTKAWQEFEEAHCPYRGLREASLKRHSEVRVFSFTSRGGLIFVVFILKRSCRIYDNILEIQW